MVVDCRGTPPPRRPDVAAAPTSASRLLLLLHPSPSSEISPCSALLLDWLSDLRNAVSEDATAHVLSRGRPTEFRTSLPLIDHLIRVYSGQEICPHASVAQIRTTCRTSYCLRPSTVMNLDFLWPLHTHPRPSPWAGGQGYPSCQLGSCSTLSRSYLKSRGRALEPLRHRGQEPGWAVPSWRWLGSAPRSGSLFRAAAPSDGGAKLGSKARKGSAATLATMPPRCGTFITECYFLPTLMHACRRRVSAGPGGRIVGSWQFRTQRNPQDSSSQPLAIVMVCDKLCDEHTIAGSLSNLAGGRPARMWGARFHRAPITHPFPFLLSGLQPPFIKAVWMHAPPFGDRRRDGD